jgi:hypothetical protein
MWIIQYLPEIVVHTIFTAGVLGVIAGFVLGFIPSIKPYKLAVQVISLLVLTFGVYLEGALADTKEWELKVKELEVKVAQAEAKSAQVNTVIQERVVTKTQVVREKAQEVIKYIDRDVVKKEEVVKFVERCSLPQDVVDAHNKAVDELNKATEKKK